MSKAASPSLHDGSSNTKERQPAEEGRLERRCKYGEPESAPRAQGTL